MRFVWILIAASLWLAGATVRGENFALTTKKLGVTTPNDPCLYDLDADGDYELLVSGVGGEVAAYKLPECEPLWMTRLNVGAVTAPSVGDLTGTGEPIVCVATTKGGVIWLRGGSGEVLATTSLGLPISIAPTVLPANSHSTSTAEAVVVCDEQGGIHMLAWKDQHIETKFSIPNWLEGATGDRIVLGRINYPASVADVDGDGRWDIVVGTALGKIVVIDSGDPARRFVWHGPQGTNINTNVVAADFFGLGRDALVFATSTGNLFAVIYDPLSQQLKTAVAQVKLGGTAAGHMLAADFDNDGLADLVASTANALLSFAPGAGFSLRGQPYGANAPPFSSVALAAVSAASYRAIVTDNKGSLHLIDPTKSTVSAVLPVGEIAESSVFGGHLTHGGRLQVVFLARNKQRLVLATLSERAAYADALPTMTFGGTFYRNGQLTTATLARLTSARARFGQRLEGLLATATSALQGGNLGECRRALDTLLALVPHHPQGRRLARQLAWREHWKLYVAATLLLLAATGAGGWALWRARHRRNIVEHANKLIEIEAYPQAAALLSSLYRKDPHNRTALFLLARVYALWGRTEPEAIAVLETGHDLFPDETQITLALAKAYATEGVETDKALELYQISLAVMEEGRGDIAYRAARLLEGRGDFEQAIRYYRLAQKEGCMAPDITARLVELYLATNQFTERTLPAFEELYAERTQDKRFLEGLCRAQAAARRVDNRARAAASNLLSLDGNSVIALRQLAKCELHTGRLDSALAFAERAYELAPDDDETVLVMALCCAACDLTTPKAAAVYQRALQLDPDNPTLLRSAALSLPDGAAAQEDAAYELLVRAVEAHPRDAELLRALARTAAARGDMQRALACYEQLVALGDTSSATYCALAEIYAAGREYGAKAIPAYEEALQVDPENATYLSSLAHCYVAANRKDPPAIVVIEKALQKAPQERELGVYLARHYLETERFDDALKLARWLLQSDKENEEIQKLVAQASFASNRLDEAIAQYRHLLSHHPEDPDARVNLALAFARKHRTDAEAAERYTDALEVSPDQALLRFMLARHHAMAGRYGAALEQLGEIVRRSKEHHRRVLDEIRLYLTHAPDRPDLRWFLVNLLIEMGEFNEACEQLDALLALDPTETRSILQAYDKILSKETMNTRALAGKAKLLRIQGRHEQARPLLEQAYRIDPRDAELRNQLVDLYEELASESDDTELRFALAQLYFADGAYDKAIALLQKTVQDFRYENESIKLLGQCFMAKGMLEFAFQEFRKLLIDEEVKDLLYTLAQKYEAKGDLVGAKQVYRLLFSADMNYRDVKLKFELLAGATSDPLATERSTLISQLGEQARNRYELIEELGRGAMGIVYRARDNELDEFVALKILPENLSQNPDALHRFRAEARAARRLSHPNIVRIHDIGEEKGRKYISMEIIKGTDLKRYLRQKGRLSVDEAVAIAIPICEALDYAHRNGIIHRDIKPANIMLTETGVPKLSDFGIAKALEATSETLTGAIIGTPLYMSPEQVQGKPADARADLYSLGITLYELLAGKPPFTEGDIAYQHCRVPPRPIDGVPSELNEIILKCLEKDRDNRWKSAGELAEALRRFLQQWREKHPTG